MLIDAAHLLDRGFLPKELPPAFQSAGFGGAVRSYLAANTSLPDQPKNSALALWALARQGNLRRHLAIPNPLHYAGLCLTLEKYNSEIEGRFAGASRSFDGQYAATSIPVPGSPGAGRAVHSLLSDDRLLEPRARVRARARVLVRTDIASCYANIYTHTLEWALVGRERAKAAVRDKKIRNNWTPDEQRRYTMAGELDRAVQAQQLGETRGLPIGPDGSLVIAELLLSAVDRRLLKERPALRGYRHSDDFEFGVESTAEATEVLSLLQGVLSDELRLELNTRKTRIIELPAPLELPWVTALKSADLRGPPRAQRRAMIRLFDQAFAFRQQHPDEHVLAYLIGILNHYSLDRENWALGRDLILQIMAAEYGILPKALHELLCYRQAGVSVPLDDVAAILNATVERQAPLGHGSEVAWALWGLHEFGLKITSNAGKHLERSKDPVAALVGLHLWDAGLWTDAPELGSWAQMTAREELYGEAWILAYEAAHRGWLAPPSGAGTALDDAFFKHLHDSQVSFYDPIRRLDLHRRPVPVLDLPGAGYGA